jgi:hypothetical protein
VPRPTASHPVATLWELAFNDDRVSCVVYRQGDGFELRLEAGPKTILSEPCDLRPRAIARAEALRRSLKRRGWQESAT